MAEAALGRETWFAFCPCGWRNPYTYRTREEAQASVIRHHEREHEEAGG